jgi:hypothetical protein
MVHFLSTKSQTKCYQRTLLSTFETSNKPNSMPPNGTQMKHPHWCINHRLCLFNNQSHTTSYFVHVFLATGLSSRTSLEPLSLGQNYSPEKNEEITVKHRSWCSECLFLVMSSFVLQSLLIAYF